MILKTKILFNDVLAEELGTKPNEVWGDFYLDLNEVAGFGSYVKDGEEYKELTEVTIKNIGGRVIKITVGKFKALMNLGPWKNKNIVE